MYKLKYFLLTLLGFLICFYIFYIRVLRERLPRDLETNLYAKGGFINLFIYFCIIILFITLFFLQCKALWGNQEKKGIFANLFSPLSGLYGNSIEQFHIWFLTVTGLGEYGTTIPQNFGLYLCKHFFGKEKIIILYIFIILPKLIVLFAFFIDIFIFAQFNYFYKFSILLLLPIIERYLLGILEYFSRVNCEQMDEIFIICITYENRMISCEHYFNGLADFTILSTEVNFRFTDTFLEQQEGTAFCEKNSLVAILDQLHGILYKIKYFLIYYTIEKRKIIPYFHLFLYLTYAVLWAYVLIYCI